jgi:hypothetical protein
LAWDYLFLAISAAFKNDFIITDGTLIIFSLVPKAFISKPF